jgi:hypothetical protein
MFTTFFRCEDVAVQEVFGRGVGVHIVKSLVGAPGRRDPRGEPAGGKDLNTFTVPVVVEG